MPGSSECIFSPRMVALSAFERRDSLAASQPTRPESGARKSKSCFAKRRCTTGNQYPAVAIDQRGLRRCAM